MSIDWFRWHHGSISDPKFTVIARKSKQPRSLVLAVWAALLETASQADDRGSLEGVEIDTIAACLDVEEDAVSAIYQAAVDKGLIADGRIASWDRRQVYREDDDSKDRVRRFREKQKQSQEKYQENDQSIAPVTQGNAPVTQGNAPVTPQITDTDTDQNREEQIRTEKSVSPAQARPPPPPPPPKNNFPPPPPKHHKKTRGGALPENRLSRRPVDHPRTASVGRPARLSRVDGRSPGKLRRQSDRQWIRLRRLASGVA